MAYRLADRYAGRLLHVADLGWHQWDGTRWALDKDGSAVRAVADTLRAALLEAVDLAKPERDALIGDVRKCETSAGARGVLDLAGALEPLTATADSLDADPWILNLANGTLQLASGVMRDHDPADRITKVCTASYDPDVRAPEWDQFLSDVLPDAEVRSFLQRVLGLALLGKVVEHFLPMLTGVGRNGKGTLLRVVAAVMGDYAIEAAPDLLIARDRAHPTELMDLRGVRLATLEESDEGRRLAVGTMKRLTGGDLIRARAMRQDFIEFTPSHTALMVTNHLPKVPGDDPALWARLRIVPFDVSFIGREDTGLEDRLMRNLDGVLAWLLAGWFDYQHRRGLDAPDGVVAATERYRASADALSRFIDEGCYRSEAARVAPTAFWSAWSEWCRRNGEEPGTQPAMPALLDRRGFTQKRAASGRFYSGLGLLARDDE